MKEIMRVSNTDILLGAGLVEVVNPLEGRGIFRWLRDASEWRILRFRQWCWRMYLKTLRGDSENGIFG